MADWLTKSDLQRLVDNLDDDAILCPYCLSAMHVYAGDEGDYYSCPNLQCLNEAMIPEETVLQAQS